MSIDGLEQKLQDLTNIAGTEILIGVRTHKKGFYITLNGPMTVKGKVVNHIEVEGGDILWALENFTEVLISKYSEHAKEYSSALEEVSDKLQKLEKLQ